MWVSAEICLLNVYGLVGFIEPCNSPSADNEDSSAGVCRVVFVISRAVEGVGLARLRSRGPQCRSRRCKYTLAGTRTRVSSTVGGSRAQHRALLPQSISIIVECADLLAERLRPPGQPAKRPQSTRRQRGLFRRRLRTLFVRSCPSWISLATRSRGESRSHALMSARGSF